MTAILDPTDYDPALDRPINPGRIRWIERRMLTQVPPKMDAAFVLVTAALEAAESYLEALRELRSRKPHEVDADALASAYADAEDSHAEILDVAAAVGLEVEP